MNRFVFDRTCVVGFYANEIFCFGAIMSFFKAAEKKKGELKS